MSTGNNATKRKVLAAGAIGNFVEYYDIGMYGLFATTIATVFFPGGNPTTALLYTFAIYAVGYFARPLGGIILGNLGDRLGRRFVLQLSLLLMSGATVGMGLLPSYAQIGIAAPVLLLLCRLAQGVSVGAEFTASNIFVVEYAPYGQRGRYASITSAATSVPTVVGVLIALAITTSMSPEQLASWGWRVPFLAAAPLALVGVYLRRQVDESPEFTALRDEGNLESAPLKQALKVAKRPMAILIGWTMAYAVAVYLFGTFLLSYLTVTVKFSKAEAMVVQFVWATVLALTAVLAGYAIDRVGRKRIAVASALGVGIWVIPTFLLLQQHPSLSEAALIVAMCAFLVGGMITTTALAGVELFPAHLRGTASGLANNISITLFGTTAPLVSTWLVGHGHPLAPGCYLAGLCAIAAAVAAIAIGNRTQTDCHNDVTLAPAENSPHAST